MKFILQVYYKYYLLPNIEVFQSPEIFILCTTWLTRDMSFTGLLNKLI